MTRQEKVLQYIESHPCGATPTDIGMYIGFDYNRASSSVTYSLAKLINKGMISRVIINGRVVYKKRSNDE